MQSGFTCMIVDDEQDAIDFLSNTIRECCLDLQIVATANSSGDAIRKYLKFVPDLIFLDIEVDELNGFDILNEIYSEKRKPHIIFVTGYNRYAIEAFKTSALGYILKPVIPEDLVRAVQRFNETKELEIQHDKWWNFIREYSGKIRFNTTSGFILIHPSEVVYCEADHNYTRIFTTAEKSQLVSLNLAVVEEMLGSGEFSRISRSLLINCRYLTSVHRRTKACTLQWQGKEIVLTGSGEMIKKL